MQIVCPNCKTFYQIAATAIGASGRSARCVRCRHIWFVPATGMVPAAPPAKPAAAPAAKAETADVAAFSAELGAPPLETTLPPAVEPAAAARKTPADAPANDGTGPNAPAAAADSAEAESAPSEPAEPAPVALSDVTIAIENAPPLVPAPGDGAPPAAISAGDGSVDIETVAARRARAAAQRRRGLRIPLPAVIAVLLVAIATLLGLRKDVVAHVPQLASFYSAIGLPVNLRGVAFTELKIGNEIHDGVPVLVVEGMIVSMVSKPVEMPRLRFALRNASGAEIYSWTTQPAQPVLEPFDAMPFRSRLAAPPAEGHDVQVRFFTRRDAVASH